MSMFTRRGLLWLLQFAVTLCASLIVAACLSLATGCGSVAQRTVSALAVAAVTADKANAMAYEAQAEDAVERVRAHGGDFADWCALMREPWERASRAECAIEAVADAALAGQAVLDADGTLGPSWFSVACATVMAVEDAWSAAETAPEVLSAVRAAVCSVADGAREGPPQCADPGPPPPCEEVSP